MHLSELDIDGFQKRQLAADTLLRVTDHAAECPECRRRLGAARDMGTQLADLKNSYAQHLSAQELQEYVDGVLVDEARRTIDNHLRQCTECNRDVAQLRGFARSYRRTQPHRLRWMLAAAAVVLLAIGAGLWMRWPAPVVLAIQDGGQRVTLDTRGQVHGAGDLTSQQSQALTAVLSGGSLSPPPFLRELQPPASTLMGNSQAPPFRLVGPVGTAVLTSTPELRWTAWEPKATYIVTLQDLASGTTISSPPLSGLSWKPAQPLQLGAVYSWQVAGTSKGREELSPKPPQPPARFRVLDPAEAARLQTLPESHLLRAIFFAQAGLLDEADSEARALQSENPGSSFTARLSRQIQDLRK